MQTLEAFDGAVDWALSANFTQQDIDEAKLAIFQKVQWLGNSFTWPLVVKGIHIFMRVNMRYFVRFFENTWLESLWV